MEASLPEWMNDESIKDIPKEKLLFLNEIFHNPSLGNQKNLLLYLPKLLKQAKERNLLFTTDEFNRCVTAIKKYSCAEDLKSIDKILGKANEMNRQTTV